MIYQIGIHVSGANSDKTAVCVLASEPPSLQTKIVNIHEKIGPQGKLFSDDRIIEIIQALDKTSNVVFDCPLTFPPCVRCVLPVCPGVNACSDLEVGYMQALSQKFPKKTINPQSHRIQELYLQSVMQESFHYAPPPLSIVTRARTLEKRLRDLPEIDQLHEALVPLIIRRLRQRAGTNKLWEDQYKDFFKGRDIRAHILQDIEMWADLSEHKERVTKHIGSFEAFMAALAGHFYTCGLTAPADAAVQNFGRFSLLPIFNTPVVSDQPPIKIA